MNVQLRWAKTDSRSTAAPTPGTCSIRPTRPPPAPASRGRTPASTTPSRANGQMTPAVPIVTLTGVTVDGVSLGNVTLQHGSSGLTQFADANGNVQVNTLQQNGYPAGTLQSVSVNDKGRVVGTYSNGRTIDLAADHAGQLQRRRRPEAHRRRRVRRDRRIRPADLQRLRQDRRLLARRLEHRHRRRIHQADRHAAGLFGQHPGDHDQQPDGAGSPEHAAVTSRTVRVMRS